MDNRLVFARLESDRVVRTQLAGKRSNWAIRNRMELDRVVCVALG